MEHQLEAWGGFSDEVSDYTEIDIPQRLVSGDDVAKDLEAIVDPFAFRERITVPKLMITGTNDSYWTLDALDLYYDDLVGDRYVMYVPNAGHGLGSGIARAVGGIAALFLATDGRLRFPVLGWESSAEDGALRLALTSDIAPETVRAWTASSPSRDFRDAAWEDHAMTREGGIYILRLDLPEDAYLAVFGDAEFPMPDGPTFFLSTRVSMFKDGERISR
jgi:PhoPQ-activated pathogenicity-related protein